MHLFRFELVLLPRVEFVLVSIVSQDLGLSVFQCLISDLFDLLRVVIVFADARSVCALVDHLFLTHAVRLLDPLLRLRVMGFVAELGASFTDFAHRID